MIEHIGEHLRIEGDGPLAPKEDPYGFQTSPPGISFIAQSVTGRLMTWEVLQNAVEGLWRCLPLARRYYGAKFQIWDYQDDFQWGFGEITTKPLGTPISTIAAIGNDTSSARVTESTASDAVLAA